MLRLSLERVHNVAQAPRAEVNLELAHAYWEGETFVERFKSEFAKSHDLCHALKISDSANRVSTCVLVDDKRILPGNRKSWLEREINLAPEVFSKIDYVVLESELKSRLLIFYKTLRPDKRSSIEAEIERYVKSKRITACSHDIAIWHVMRSGALGYKSLPVFQLCSAERKSDRLVPSFCAPRTISILNQGDREHEEDAETKILKYVDESLFDWRNIERIYYY